MFNLEQTLAETYLTTIFSSLILDKNEDNKKLRIVAWTLMMAIYYNDLIKQWPVGVQIIPVADTLVKILGNWNDEVYRIVVWIFCFNQCSKRWVWSKRLLLSFEKLLLCRSIYKYNPSSA